MPLFDIFKRNVEKITDEIQLEQIGINKSDPEASIKAIARLKNQTILAKIAMENPHKEVKNRAMKKITDQMLLADVLASFVKYFGVVNNRINSYVHKCVARSELCNEVKMFRS